jgi:excisionase family DNA binding protein
VRRAAQAGPKMSITREDVLTVADVATLLDLKPYTVKEYARRGILPGRKLGRNWRFLRPELEDAIQRLPKPSS